MSDPNQPNDPVGDTSTWFGKLVYVLNVIRTIIKDAGIVIAAIAGLWAAIHVNQHTGTLQKIEQRQESVEGETLKTQAVAAKTLVNITGDPEDKKTLKAATQAVTEHQREAK